MSEQLSCYWPFENEDRTIGHPRCCPLGVRLGHGDEVPGHIDSGEITDPFLT
ncbi:hypothetical protein AB0D30_00965 [Streptomyces sp. NPDC048409]|uniref:hypothetical protein n=1 Tax=Streptomyces sp. NPDC048409 TaxID=3154723 RepID=UPI00343683A2